MPGEGDRRGTGGKDRPRGRATTAGKQGLALAKPPASASRRTVKPSTPAKAAGAKAIARQRSRPPRSRAAGTTHADAVHSVAKRAAASREPATIETIEVRSSGTVVGRTGLGTTCAGTGAGSVSRSDGASSMVRAPNASTTLISCVTSQIAIPVRARQRFTTSHQR